MKPRRSISADAYTLIEVVLVIAILVAVAGMVIPSFIRDMERERLPGSARRLRSFLNLVQANAAFDGMQYRFRFPLEDELDPLGGVRQPIVEREEDPLEEPEVYYTVTAPWAVGTTLLDGVWCCEVRLGRPSVATLRALERRSEVADELEQAFKDFDPIRPPLVFQPDGRCDWVTFVLTDAPPETRLDDLYKEDADKTYRVIEVILDGTTGQAWLQRPLYEEELDLFEERNWPVVLRQDFLDPRVLTEEDVLELHDVPVDR